MAKRRKVSGRSGEEQAAAELGLTYDKKPARDVRKALVLPRGFIRSGELLHLCTGDLAGRELMLCEHRYLLHTGQATIPIIHTIYSSVAPDWPEVHVKPMSFFGRLARRLGLRKSLQLDDDRFNRAFSVKASDELFAVTLLSPDLQRLMLEKTSGVSWWIGRERVFLIYKGKLRADRMDRSIERLRRFWECVPPELENWTADA